MSTKSFYLQTYIDLHQTDNTGASKQGVKSDELKRYIIQFDTGARMTLSAYSEKDAITRCNLSSVKKRSLLENVMKHIKEITESL